MKSLLIIGFLIIALLGFSQTGPENGLKESTPTYYALKDATIYLSPSEKDFKWNNSHQRRQDCEGRNVGSYFDS